MLVLPYVVTNWHVMAVLLFLWGGVVAALYTIGLAHLGSRLPDTNSPTPMRPSCCAMGSAWCSARR